ncbi:MAG: PDZ domain-containing protein [Syntrophomonadales bacterium]
MQERQPAAGLAGYSRQYLHATLVATVAGILGGFLGSFLLVLFGIDIARLGLIYLFAAALLLMMIHPRFLCFAYAGGLLSLFSLTVGFPRIQVADVMGLVAILHLVESLLILFTGHLDPIPVYLRTGRGNVGGFNLQKFWPIPLVAMMSTGLVPISTGTESWWPLLKDGTGLYEGLSFSLVPVLAILGYGELTTTATPGHRSRSSALYLALFSVMLLGLAVLGSHYPSLLFLAALFGPLGHEMVVAIGRLSEGRHPPIYAAPPQGVMVLDVIHRSPAERAGLHSGDIITELNGRAVYGPADLILAGNHLPPWLSMTVLRQGRRLVLSTAMRAHDYLGIIPVPGRDGPAAAIVVPNDSGILASILRRFRKP